MAPPKRSKKELCSLLRDNFSQLINEFSDIYRDDVALMGLTCWFTKCYNNEVDEGKRPYNEMMLTFIEHVYPFKRQILEKEEVYFEQNADRLFKEHLGYVISIKKYIFGTDNEGHPMLNRDQKNTIWQYFLVFIKLMDRYIELDPSSYLKKNL